MSPLNILFVSAGLWALTHLWILPLSKQRWKRADLRQKIARASALVALKKIRDLSVITTIVVSSVLIFVWVCGVIGSNSVNLSRNLIDKVAAAHTLLKNWTDAYANIIIFVGLLGAALTLYLSARQAKKRLTAIWFARATEVRERLVNDSTLIGEAGRDPDLLPIVQRLAQATSLLSQHQDGGEATLSEHERGIIEQDISSLLWMLSVEIARKEIDVETSLATPSAEEAAVKTSRRQRWARFFASKRLREDLGLLQKPASYAVSALFIVSLIGWSAEPLADSLQLVVNNLRVNLLAEEAQRDLESALSKDEEVVSETTDADTGQVAQQIAQATVRGLLRSGVIDRIDRTRGPLDQSELVRARIAEQHVGLPDGMDSVSRVRKETGQAIARGANDNTESMIAHISDRLQEVVEPSVQRLQKEQPGAFARLAVTLKARYAGSPSPLDAQSQIISRVLDQAFGAVDAHSSTELARQAQKILKEFGKEATQTWAKAYAERYLADLLLGEARADVLAAGFRFETSDETKRFVAALQDAEGRWVTSGTELERSKRDRKVAAAVAAQDADTPTAAVARHNLGGYDELFPTIAEWTPNDAAGPGSAPNFRRPTPKPVPATDFHLASRSFRVRGVLIGRDLGGDSLDIKDLRWSLRTARGEHPALIALDARVGDEWVTLGSFAAGIVNQGLRYAADRRVVATTILPGDGNVFGRITSLHPVLTDTPLGCRIVEADRWVDTFTYNRRNHPVDPRLQQIAFERKEIGRWQWMVSIAEDVATRASGASCPRVQLQSDLDKLQRRNPIALGNVRFSLGMATALDRLLDQEGATNPASVRFLRGAHACATDTPEKLGACLCDEVGKAGLSREYWFPEDHTSQFRERTAVLSRDFGWLKPSANHLEHIEFWIHTTLAKRDASTHSADEATAVALDFPEEQLHVLRQVIIEQLPRYLAETLDVADLDDFLGPIEEFVLVQRFMRAAFAGSLGRDFPLMKLVQLEQDTRDFVPHQPTIRWEPPDSKEKKEKEETMLVALRTAEPSAAEAYAAWRNDVNARSQSHKPLCDRAAK